MNTRKAFINVCKLALSGATVAAIAFAFGVFDHTGEVATSDADILALNFGDRTSTEKFVAGLKELGHDAPQVYNLNGNQVFFSSAIQDGEPLEVMERYQREFYEQGLNPAIYTDINDDNADEMFKTSVSGGVVPLVVSPDNILLGGMESTGPTKTYDDLMKNFEKNKGKAPWKLFDAHRYIEINRDGEKTLVTSSWSDKGFDYAKMIPGAKITDTNTDVEVPSCPGCLRLTNFSDQGGKSTYRNNVFWGTADVAQQAKFYDQAMLARGWEPTESTQIMDKLNGLVEFEGQDGVMREYVRNGEHMQVLALPDPQGGTMTHTVVTD
ncbi:MAG: hypothetical protein R3E66_13990 [bacterium]